MFKSLPVSVETNFWQFGSDLEEECLGDTMFEKMMKFDEPNDDTFVGYQRESEGEDYEKMLVDMKETWESRDDSLSQELEFDSFDVPEMSPHRTFRPSKRVFDLKPKEKTSVPVIPQKVVVAPIVTPKKVPTMVEPSSPVVERKVKVVPQAHKTTKSCPKPKRKPRRKKCSGSSDQVDCCIKNCTNTVTNRLRFSLRCLGENDFKEDYVAKGFDKVCHYHYFSDLYRWKKSKKLLKNQRK